MSKKRNRTTAVKEGANGEAIYVNGPRAANGLNLTSSERSARIRELEARLDDLDSTAGQCPVTAQKHEIGAGTITVDLGTLRNLKNQKRFRRKLEAATGHVMPKFSDREWQVVLRAFEAIAVEFDCEGATR